MVLVINYEEDMSLFGLLQSTIQLQADENVRFILSGFYTVEFNEHLHCYEVTQTDEWFLVAYRELISFHPMYTYFPSNNS